MKHEGENMRAARMRKGLSISTLAELSGIPFSTLQAYETGRRNPGINTKYRISSTLDVPFEKIWTATAKTLDVYMHETVTMLMDLARANAKDKLLKKATREIRRKAAESKNETAT